MFDLLLSGRLVDTSFRQVNPTHAVIDIVGVNAFNHVVVFLTGQQFSPDEMGWASRGQNQMHLQPDNS